MARVTYHFRFADGSTASLASDAAAALDPASLPAWTRLAIHQCPNCPLQAATTPHCPMATQFVPLIALVGSLRSYDAVQVRVDTPERQVGKATTLQRAIGSVMGLLAANSNCPRTRFLQPMAHFHLPFASEEESLYRAASTYLLDQYFRRQAGGVPDWDMAGLKAHYTELQQVNTAMAQRLRTAASDDGAINAIILLDLLAKAMPYSIDEKLEEIAATFAPTSLPGH